MKLCNGALALGLVVAAVACGGQAEQEQDDTPSTLQQCRDLCEKEAECKGDSASEGQDCEDG